MATISKIKTPDGNTYDITGSTIYATCDTAGATVAKVATLVTADVNTFALYTGCRVIVRFANANTAEKPTLQVGNTPAVQIMRYGTTAANKTSSGSGGIPAGAVQAFTYDGTYWVMDYWTDANSTYSNASLGNGYATCSTAEATTAKVGTLSSYALSTGGQVSVKFTYAVPASSTLNINSKGAKDIYFNGAAIPAGIIKAGDVATFVYSTQYHLVALNGSVVTAGSYGPSANATLSASGTFTVPQVTVDATGRVTGAKNVTYTLPADNNTTYTSKAAASGGTEVSLVTTGEKYTWNNKSSLAIGTTSTTAAAGNHAHGNITNSGTITSTAVTTATGVLVYDSSNKIQRATAANVRSIIGAGTSDLAIGTTSTTAAAGNHTHSSYVNQNAFSNITVGSTTIAADSATDTFTLVAGDNITLTPDATNDKITFTAKDTTYGVVSTTADGLAPKRDGSTTKFLRGDGTWAVPPDTNTTYSSKSAASGGTDVSLVTTGEKYTWNNKSNLAIGTTSTTAAAGNHTHTTTIATSSGTNELTLAHGTKYAITAGGDSFIFTMPSDNNTDAVYSGVAYCSTAASTAAKVATMPKFALASGQYILLRTTVTNSATSSVTLNVNSTGAKPVKIGNSSTAPTASNFPAGDYLANYDGTNWVLTRIHLTDNNTTYSSKTAASGGTDVSLVTTGEKYTWNNKSNLAIGTTSTTAAAGNHTHSSYAPKASPAFTGTPTAPTASAGTNSTQIATTAFVQNALSSLPGDEEIGNIVNNIIASSGAAHIVEGQYSGTGTSPTLTFDFDPKLFICYSASATDDRYKIFLLATKNAPWAICIVPQGDSFGNTSLRIWFDTEVVFSGNSITNGASYFHSSSVGPYHYVVIG